MHTEERRRYFIDDLSHELREPLRTNSATAATSGPELTTNGLGIGEVCHNLMKFELFLRLPTEVQSCFWLVKMLGLPFLNLVAVQR